MKRLLVYPIPFALNYFLLKDFLLRDTFLWAAILTLITYLIIAGLNLFFENWRRSGYVAILILVWALYYGTVFRLVDGWLGFPYQLYHHFLFLTAWTAFLLFLGSRWLWQRKLFSDYITLYLNSAFFIILGFAAVQVYQIEAHHFLDPPDRSMTEMARSVKTSARPDIYYIIVDAYGRADILDEIYHYDNSEFINFLSSQGFYVAEKSQSNYLQTVFSITSSLNMEYLNVLQDNTIRRSQLMDDISDNQLRTFLEAIGYKFVTFSSYNYYTDITDSDYYFSLSKMGAPGYPDTQVIYSSIGTLARELYLFPRVEYLYKNQQAGILFTLNELKKIPTIPGPKFIFAHLVAPHPDYIFDANGPVTPEKLYGYDQNTREDWLVAYPGQLAYLNKLLEKTIMGILQNSSTPPIIILQGDHGPGAYFNLQSANASCLNERASIMNAFLVPGIKQGVLYPSITPVNSFRLILNEYFGTTFKIQEDRTYYSTEKHPFSFADVSAKCSQACIISPSLTQNPLRLLKSR